MSTKLSLLVLALATACTEAGPDPSRPSDGNPGGKTDGSSSGPTALTMQCWDGSFAYNVLTVIESNDELRFTVSGANLAIKQLHENDGWRPGTARFAIPRGACVLSADDRRLLACGADNVAVDVQRSLEAQSPSAAGVVEHIHLETQHVVRTNAGGDVFETVDLELTTGWSPATKLELRFGVQPPCELDPASFQFPDEI